MARKYSPRQRALRSPVQEGGPVPEPPPEVLATAREIGLELRAVVPAGPLPEEVVARLDHWLASGRAGDMKYLAQGRSCMADLRVWKDWGRSLLLFAMPYRRAPGQFRDGGRVAQYALGRDYHHLIGKRLERLGKHLRRSGQVSRFRAFTDAAPVLEREWALLGSVGFRGKNTLLLDPQLGPWQLLGELLVDTPWPAWCPQPREGNCGSCTRCLDACPTAAFTGAYELDPRRCISYLTIEHRGPIPRDLRPKLGDWVFGCDVCLEVCPFGTRQPDQGEHWGRLPALDQLSLEDLLGLSAEDFATHFRGSPLKRPGWAGLLRNACVALGNLGRGESALIGALEHPDALVRGHAAWALGRLGIHAPLERRTKAEEDPQVRDELDAALQS